MGDDGMYVKLCLLGIMTVFSFYRLHEHHDFMTLCATVIVAAAFILSAFYVWRHRRDEEDQ
jgi:Ca2+/H+ antiporter